MNGLLKLAFTALLSIGLLLSLARPALADPAKGLVTADYVTVRAQPDRNAQQLGFLYKNMVVQITSQTHDMDKIGDASFYWFEVKGKDVSGWVYGKFLSSSAANWNVDTYDAPGNVDWLATRFGESTWYYADQLDMTAFSMDDYRNLMVAAANGNEGAWDALVGTILKHLKEDPDDAAYAYLKKRLYSEDYLAQVVQYEFAFRNENLLQLIPATGKVLGVAADNNPQVVYNMPLSAWQDPTVVAEVKRRCNTTFQGVSLVAGTPDPDNLYMQNNNKIASICARK